MHVLNGLLSKSRLILTVSFGLAIAASWGPANNAFCDEAGEAAALKAMVRELRESMEKMAADHAREMETLRGRIDELESKNAQQEFVQEQLQESALEQETTNAVLRSTLLDRVHWSGYYDFEYLNRNNEGVGTFRQHHLSLFLSSATEDDRWRTFSEIEFEDAPDFSFTEQSGSGSINIESAWLEYKQSDAFRLRMGKLLLPQYWQTYHYPNLTLSTMRPLMVGALFPETIVGLQAHGEWWWRDDRGLSYAGYVGNGRHDADIAMDANDNKSVGGRLTLHLARGDLLDTLDISVSGFSGRDENDNTEHVFGLDTQIRLWKLELLSEYAQGSQHGRHDLGALRRFRPSESQTEGFYVQIGYHFFPKWHAFYRYDLLNLLEGRPGPHDAEKHTFGLNYRPRSYTSLKLEGFHAQPEGWRDGYEGVATSVVFNF